MHTQSYLITFPSPKVADSWWRTILTDSVESGYKEYSSIQRLSPQFYIYDSSKIDISKAVYDDRWTKEFCGTLFFASLGTMSSIAPVIDHPDYRNGSSITFDPPRIAADTGTFKMDILCHRLLVVPSSLFACPIPVKRRPLSSSMTMKFIYPVLKTSKQKRYL
ncbi:hypothetical protein JOM56_007728 [Amanita muscaria]